MAEQREDKIVRKFDINRLRKQTTMPLITVYKYPTDYPDKFVARVWDVNKPTFLVATADTLEELRETIPEEMYNIGRSNKDDPCIVEIWI